MSKECLIKTESGIISIPELNMQWFGRHKDNLTWEVFEKTMIDTAHSFGPAFIAFQYIINQKGPLVYSDRGTYRTRELLKKKEGYVTSFGRYGKDYYMCVSYYSKSKLTTKLIKDLPGGVAETHLALTQGI
jgi:hypothetical protein